MTYANTVLTQELQRAVEERQTPDSQNPAPSLPETLDYEVSPQAQDYLRQLRDYREKARNVRVGRY